MKKIFLDKGHGGSDPGAVANGLKEKDLTHRIVEYAMDYLQANYTEFAMRTSRKGDETLTLSQRAKMANDWGADVFVSVHINAGKGTGFETYVYNGGVSSRTIALQNVLHSEILAAMRQFGNITDRGKKRANYAVLRETAMPAVLTENLFIDSNDAKLLKNEAFLKAVGEAHARGIAKFLGLPQKAKPQPQPKPQQKVSDKKLYRVQVGAFAEKENAERLAAELKKKGYPAIIV
ncbi:N-acetylmuramoyl-L-alanine amidase [Parageobacillus thermantarcticus]|uniref:N-acetylmuramoyl-L-alanine amidase n=1 Tax=Parageobacillus thermantarcticus TaxID=186116 RepID=A0A1I0TGG5_9BACL|nr:N-acetylmuramoyl-L-alanine amidase [Parageobacillus thermantarcticus]SFA50888.1 N-acetylmuramoyl-L-alanine amidase [Parageobacillus thermantarcticus]